MTMMCQDPMMIDAYKNGKDLYAQIAALSFDKSYRECLEFQTDEDGKWILDKNGDRVTYPEGKERRTQAKSILLGVLYGRGVPSIAEQLGISTKKAQEIKDSVFYGFPAIEEFEQDTLGMAQTLGYVTTLWGRKRRLPDMTLPDYEFTWASTKSSDDPLDFDDEEEEVPEELMEKYLRKLSQCWGSKKRAIFEQANAEGIWIIDNTKKKADASRQCVNARIQGSASDMTKLAMALINNDARLKELGLRILIPIHDELLVECPRENAKECKERFAQLMSQAPGEKFTIPINCDVDVFERWYGEKIDV